MIYDLPVEKSTRPPNWCVLELNQLADVVGGGTPDTDEPVYWNPPEIPWVTPTDITACAQPVLTKTERRISRAGLNESSATLLPVGTTLLTSRATVGECRIAGVPAATNQGFASLVPHKGTPPEFLFYLAQTLRPAFVRLAAGTTFVEVSRREVRRVKVCVPSDAGERFRIGGILQSVDDAIQALGAKLAAAQRLKTALMQQLFTRGIPGRHTRFKQTKIGLIPGEWELKRGRECFRLGGYSGAAPEVVSGHGDSLYLKVDDFNTEGNETVLRTAAVKFDADQNPDLQLFPPGAIVFAKRGAALLKNRVRILGVTSAVDPNLMVMSPKPGAVSTQFLFHFLAHFKLGRLCEDAGIPQLNNRDLYPKVFPIPADDEQLAIIELLEAAEDTLRACNAELTAVRRLRTSLLQNLLTGRVRVRMED
jgi:type I restriction enzyme S subunit